MNETNLNGMLSGRPAASSCCYASRLPAGSATWTPALLTGDFLGQFPSSVADTAGTFVIVAFDATAHSLVTFTSAPGADFGPPSRSATTPPTPPAST